MFVGREDEFNYGWAQLVVARAIQMETVTWQMKCEAGTQKAGPGRCKFWKSLFHQHRCDGDGWDHRAYPEWEEDRRREKEVKNRVQWACAVFIPFFWCIFFVHPLTSHPSHFVQFWWRKSLWCLIKTILALYLKKETVSISSAWPHWFYQEFSSDVLESAPSSWHHVGRLKSAMVIRTNLEGSEYQISSYDTKLLFSKLPSSGTRTDV